jgi:hypothetical protein
MCEDWALYVKICLKYPVYVQSDCDYKYRQHENQTCSVARQQGTFYAQFAPFLAWLDEYTRGEGAYIRLVVWYAIGKYKALSVYERARARIRNLVNNTGSGRWPALIETVTRCPSSPCHRRCRLRGFSPRSSLPAAYPAQIVNIDALTYAAHPAALEDAVDHPRYVFEHINICDADRVRAAFSRHQPDVVIHLAAETHVDRSIDGPEVFVTTNVNGTFTMLEAARGYWQGLTANGVIGSGSTTFPPTRSMDRSDPGRNPTSMRPIVQALPMPRARRHPTTWPGPGAEPTACRYWSLPAAIISARTSIRRS